MSNKGELLITDKEEVIVNFKIPSRNKHGRTDRNLVDSSVEIRTGYPSKHSRNAYHETENLYEIFDAHFSYCCQWSFKSSGSGMKNIGTSLDATNRWRALQRIVRTANTKLFLEKCDDISFRLKRLPLGIQNGFKPPPRPLNFTFLSNQTSQFFLQLLVIVSLALSCVIAEPPIPANLGGYARQPSSQYGAPEFLGRQGGSSFPSTQYGAPGVSSRSGGGGSLSTQYGTPAASSRLGNGASNRFGGSADPASRYGPPNVSSRFGGENSLSTQYGVPSANRFGSSSIPSAQYGVPGISSRFGSPSSLSSRFGASGVSSRYEGASSVSTQYGAPSASRRFNIPKSQYALDGGYATSRGQYNAQDDDLAVST